MSTNVLENREHDIHNKNISLSYDSEVDEAEFKSLKGIAGKWLDIDEVRRERLKL